MKRQPEMPSNDEIMAAKDVIAAFLSLIKNYDLYPPEHAFSQNFLKNTHNRLFNFLAKYGELKITIEQKQLLYKKVPIHETQSAEDSFAFLYRDGLLWIEFLSGLTLEEIKTFFTIINRYKVLHDEPEDDIVTALWDENMAHIKYEAKELFFDDVPLLDFAKLNQVTVNQEAEPDHGSTASAAPEETNKIMAMLSQDEHHQWWSLSPEEFEILAESVRAAEKSVRNGDVLQVLFFVLTKQDNATDFGVVLDFLKAEWRSEIEHGNFARVAHHLTVLKQLQGSPQPNREWVVKLLAAFFADISGEGVLSSLEEAFAHLHGNDPAQLGMLKNFLILLEPEALSSLGRLVPHAKSEKVKDTLIEAMEHLADKDIAPLEDLLAHDNDLIALTVTQILGRIEGEEAAKLLAKTLRHSSPKVRRHGLRAYLAGGNPSLNELFTIIDDPDVTTRAILLDFLGRERNEKVERLLLNYLEQRSRQGQDEDHLHNCYMALGRCGSRHSLPFLRKTLLGQGWTAILTGGQAVQQHGAVKALSRLQLREATEVLKQGAASLVPVIRKSCRHELSKIARGD
jgi:hypothetical protein